MMPFSIPPTVVTLARPSLGQSPAGFQRLHVELLPREVGRLVGYDPRSLIMKPPRKTKTGRGTRDLTPHNVSPQITALQNQVQRSIDNDRVAAMVEYLRSSIESGSFADWGPIELVTAASPDMKDYESKHVAYMDADADFFIADGQHRYCAVLDFCRAWPQYCDRFTQAITISVLPAAKLVEWAGQSFHDRNYYAVAVRAGKALSVDTRDPVNALAKSLTQHPTIQEAGGVALERDTLLKGDPRFTTHSVLHRFTKGFLFGRAGLERSFDEAVDPDKADELREYLAMLGEVMPWTGEDRELYLTRTSVVLSALAVIGHDLYVVQYPVETIRSKLNILTTIDWRRSNLSWEGVIGSIKPSSQLADGTVVPASIQPASSRPAIDATIRFLRQALSVAKEPQEQE